MPDYSLGKRWFSRHRFAAASGNNYSTEYEFKVTARENVTVPAGTFDAFRVEGHGWTRGEAGAIQLTLRYWVAPRVRRFIALENFHKHSRGKILKNDRFEMMEYCCG